MALALEEYKSEINDPAINNIYALSDLHGDLFGTIISLRDCCKVIRKKEGHPYSQMEKDNQIKEYLEMDINSGSYVDDLNYEWIGGNSHVVICGDIIDNFRKDDRDPGKPDVYGMFFLEEIKLLRFLNALDEQAQTFGGKIIKLVGNHDFTNLFCFDINDVRFIKSYVNKRDTSGKFIYNGKEQFRINFFTTHDGRLLYTKGGCGLICKIHDFVFVHGSILKDKTFDYYKDLNQRFYKTIRDNMINTPGYLTLDEINSLKDTSSFLWDRSLGSEETVNLSIIDQTLTTYNRFCGEINSRINDFCNKEASCTSNTRLVMGHCPQSYSYHKNLHNSTFTQLESFSDITEVLVGPVSYSKIEYRPTEDAKAGIYFGISTFCSVNDNFNDPRIYKIDVAMSKAFDQKSEFQNIASPDAKNMLNAILSYKCRTPQVLFIKKDGDSYTTKIIRSKLGNTLIHLNRPSNPVTIEAISRYENTRMIHVSATDLYDPFS